MFTTDPAITNQRLVELDDDLGLQPAESITPLVRRSRRPAPVSSTRSTPVGPADDRSSSTAHGAAAAPDTDVGAVAAAWWAEVWT